MKQKTTPVDAYTQIARAGIEKVVRRIEERVLAECSSRAISDIDTAAIIAAVKELPEQPRPISRGPLPSAYKVFCSVHREKVEAQIIEQTGVRPKPSQVLTQLARIWNSCKAQGKDVKYRRLAAMQKEELAEDSDDDDGSS